MNDAINLSEWALFLLLSGVAGVAVYRRLPAGPGFRWGFWVLGLLLVTGAALWDRHLLFRRRQQEQVAASVPHTGRPGGYVSSDTCQSCHPEPYRTWHDSYHRTMTQYASPETIQADFTRGPLLLDGETYRIGRDGDEFWAELPDPEVKERLRKQPGAGPPPRVKKRIGLLTGSHHLQMFWIPSAVGNQQLIFPFAWLIADRQWVPVQATFLRDPTLPPSVHVWNVNCLKCHATGGQPRPDFKLGGLATRVGELGIACEACHGPAENHVAFYQNPLARYLQRASASEPHGIINPAKLSKDRSSQVCGQCHGIKWIPNSENFAQEGFSFRPGQDLDQSTPLVRPTHWREQPFLVAGLRQNPRYLDEHYWSDGMVRVSGRDFSGTVESPCYERGKMSCLSCHSMHASESRVNQLGSGKNSNDACLQCHETLRGRVEQHTHHASGSSGGECYNCHMPHTTYGLLKAIRSHQISSPTVTNSLATGRPNACNLCHLDRTLDWTADQLQTWYRQPKPVIPEVHQTTAASVVWALQGDAGQRALLAWHFGWEPALAVSRSDWVAPFLGVLISDPYSAVRFIAHRSLRRLPGLDGFEFNFVGPAGDRPQATRRVQERWRSAAALASAPGRTNSACLLTPSGDLDNARLQSLLGRRDNRSMDLQE